MDAKKFADLICPQHDRTSCSDLSRENGFGSHKMNGDTDAFFSFFRCSRCAILEILEEGYVPEENAIKYMEYFSGYDPVKAAIRFTKQ